VKYNPISKQNQIFCGTGNVAVITGWTPAKAIKEKLSLQDYGAIGQLYSPTRGISFLIRNLLANPQIRHLVLLNATEADRNSGAIEVLLWFLHYGCNPGVTDLGQKAWVIDCDWKGNKNSNNLSFHGKGYIDIGIPKSALKLLRESLSWVVVNNIKNCVNEVWGASKNTLPWGAPKSYSVPEQEVPKVLPGDRYGHRIEGKTIAETWVKIIHRIKTTGTVRPTGYDGHWQELIDLMAVITDEPEEFYFPEPNYLSCDHAFVEKYQSQILEDTPYEEGVKYTYAQRMRSWFGRDQIEEVINKLIKEIDAASAVISLWDSGGNLYRRPDGSSDHQHSGSPCLNQIWVRVVNEEISLTGVFRSNDMFSAWPANAMGLRALQQHIRDEIAGRSSYDLKMGPLITISQSAHIYSDCWDYADKLIAEHYDRLAKKEARSFADPIGSFLISVNSEANLIEVEHISPSPGNEPLQVFFGKSSQELGAKILKSCPGILGSHCFYLGSELERAERTLADGAPLYIQQ
jgi:thymidylate synthase